MRRIVLALLLLVIAPDTASAIGGAMSYAALPIEADDRLRGSTRLADLLLLIFLIVVVMASSSLRLEQRRRRHLLPINALIRPPLFATGWWLAGEMARRVICLKDRSGAHITAETIAQAYAIQDGPCVAGLV